jgi:hypothetical protein
VGHATCPGFLVFDSSFINIIRGGKKEMKTLNLEMEDDQYNSFKGVFPTLPVEQTVLFGRTPVKVRIKEVAEEAVAEKAEPSKLSTPGTESNPLDVNKDGKTDLKDVMDVAKGVFSGKKKRR